MPYLTTSHFFVKTVLVATGTQDPHLPVVVNAFDMVSLQSPHRYRAPIHPDHKENHSSTKCSQELPKAYWSLARYSGEVLQGFACNVSHQCVHEQYRLKSKRGSAISSMIPHLDELGKQF